MNDFLIQHYPLLSLALIAAGIGLSHWRARRAAQVVGLYGITLIALYALLMTLRSGTGAAFCYTGVMLVNFLFWHHH